MGSLSTLVNTVFKNVERTEWSYSGEWSVNSCYSRYHSLDFQVGGFPFNLLVNTKQETDSSFHLQFQGQDTCFVNFKLGLVNTSAENNVVREKSFRFSSMDKISGWDDFVPNGSCHEDEGFLEHGCLKFMVSATVLGEVLIDDVDLLEDSPCYGTTTWKMFNFWSLNGHSEITSNFFMISKLSFRFCLSRTVDEQYLSFFVEIPSRDFEMEESIWALLEVSMSLEKTDPKSGQKSHKPLVKMDSPGRRLGHGHGCDTRLGWTEYITMSKFGEECNENDVVKFVLAFNAIEETVKPIGLASVKWNINNFSSLKNIMKKMEKKTVKKKMKKETTGLCIESRKFCIHGRDFRLLLGLSQGLLSLFVEMLDLKDTSGGASLPFGSFCLSVISKKKNQDFKLKTHGRCSKKYVWGWSDLMTLDHLFEESLGYLVQGTAVEFEVEVRILDETFTVEDEQVSDTSSHLGTRMTVKWEVKNFISFMKDKFIYSDYFQVDGCKLRIGVCRKVDKKDQKDEILFACLSTDPSDGLKKSYVRYTIKAVNQKDDSKSLSADNVDLNLHSVREMMISGLTPSALFVCEIHHQLDTSTTKVGPSDRSASDILFTLKSATLKSKFLGNLCSGDEIAEELIDEVPNKTFK